MSHYEIFITLVAPRGINVDVITEELEKAVDNYGYDVKRINLLDIISSGESENLDAKRNIIDIEGTRLPKLRKIIIEQLAFDDKSSIESIYHPYSSLIIQKIQKIRQSTNKNTVYIIDNVKHPKELEALKQVYKKAMYTVGITDSLLGKVGIKKQQFEKEGQSEELALQEAAKYILEDYNQPKEEVIIKVEGEEQKFNMSNDVGKAYLLSDFFINLNSESFEHKADPEKLNILLRQSTERFIDLIFAAPTITPTKHEHSMFLAYTSALRSGDLSRQVGSTIVNDTYDVIAMGANEVPKSGGGQYWADERYIANTIENEKILKESVDKRDYVLGYDTNTQAKDRLSEELVNLLLNKGLISESQKEAVGDVIQKSPLKDITEYGRVVHAEMSALMSAARNGTQVKGMHMFCTTYPCHNCAKHLVAAGIQKVQYIEPYPKSRAVDSHEDSIFDPEKIMIAIDKNNEQKTIENIVNAYKNIDIKRDNITIDSKSEHSNKQHLQSSKNTGEKLIFEPFSGVGPSRYIDLFSMNMGSGRPITRKNNSESIRLVRSPAAIPRVAITVEHNEFFEKEFIKQLSHNHKNIEEQCLTAIKIYQQQYTLQKNERQSSKIKFWHRKDSYGYITSETGKEYPFNKQNLKDKNYIPQDGELVSFILLKGEVVTFADEIIKETENIINSAHLNFECTEGAEKERKLLESTILNWKPDNNFGHIKNSDGENYFFHLSQVKNCSKNKLEKGMKVIF